MSHCRYFSRYKDGIRDHSSDIVAFIRDFARWFELWAKDVSSTHSKFQDPIAFVPSSNRNLTIGHIREEIDRLGSIVERESGIVMKLELNTPKPTVTPAQRTQARIAQLAQTYDPPGHLRRSGPRHDNDFAAINEIRIAPTHDELFSPIPPYIPVFSHEAPHHLPVNSMERHLDIQFRLLREELM